jgi:hypothetical protein
MKDRIKALKSFLECKKSEIENVYDNTFSADGGEYLVVTDEEANELWEESLQNYLDECIYPELPQNMVNYFDDEKWKRDAKFDGRGHSLSHYDGHENESGEYFIYRIN